jgi:hypothetical protein
MWCAILQPVWPTGLRASLAIKLHFVGLSEDGEINHMVFNNYFSFVQTAKSANYKSFKDFRHAAQIE